MGIIYVEIDIINTIKLTELIPVLEQELSYGFTLFLWASHPEKTDFFIATQN
jgi:hypothetical protein